MVVSYEAQIYKNNEGDSPNCLFNVPHKEQLLLNTQ